MKLIQARRPLSSTIRQHRDRQERSQNREVLTKAGPSVRVPRAETRLTVYRSPLVYETRRVFSISGDVTHANVIVNLENSDSYNIEASITASE